MRALYLTQAANEEDISTVTDALPDDAEVLLLTGSDVSLNKGKILKVTRRD